MAEQLQPHTLPALRMVLFYIKLSLQLELQLRTPRHECRLSVLAAHMLLSDPLQENFAAFLAITLSVMSLALWACLLRLAVISYRAHHDESLPSACAHFVKAQGLARRFRGQRHPAGIQAASGCCAGQ